jgi:hypothetical protein
MKNLLGIAAEAVMSITKFEPLSVLLKNTDLRGVRYVVLALPSEAFNPGVIAYDVYVSKDKLDGVIQTGDGQEAWKFQYKKGKIIPIK